MFHLFATSNDPGLLIARLVLAAIFLPHGLQKTFGWFGGYGLAGTMGFFTGPLGIPKPLGALAIATENLAPVALALGLVGRVAALGIIGIMVVAAYTVHREHGFFMNWSGQQKGEGYEYHLLAIGLALVVLIGGSGPLSIDQIIAATL
jgi:putative oxidoreductase